MKIMKRIFNKTILQIASIGCSTLGAGLGLASLLMKEVEPASEPEMIDLGEMTIQEVDMDE